MFGREQEFVSAELPDKTSEFEEFWETKLRASASARLVPYSRMLPERANGTRSTMSVLAHATSGHEFENSCSCRAQSPSYVRSRVRTKGNKEIKTKMVQNFSSRRSAVGTMKKSTKRYKALMNLCLLVCGRASWKLLQSGRIKCNILFPNLHKRGSRSQWLARQVGKVGIIIVCRRM